MEVNRDFRHADETLLDALLRENLTVPSAQGKDIYHSNGGYIGQVCLGWPV